jgi:SagB-type dehydrogenase family enzyme
MGALEFLQLLNGQHSKEAVVEAYFRIKDEQEATRRSLFSGFGISKEHLFPASRLYHLHSRVYDGWWAPIDDDEASKLTYNLNYKRYPNAKKISLPKDLPSLDAPLENIIRARRSIRSFSKDPITLAELTKLLALSYGVTEWGMLPLRAAPSAGALYPIESYPIALSVDGLDKNIFHYSPLDNALEVVRAFKGIEDLFHIIPESIRIAEPAVIIAFTAVLSRVQAKYGERGYRFAHLDAGHIAQNFSLVSTAMGLGSVCIGGFFDDDLNAFLGIDGDQEVAVYGIVIGKPKKDSVE